ncbi:GIP [Symbiodinium microadriaticum]|nr:GIP [Symbiodinium microadriaticum]
MPSPGTESDPVPVREASSARPSQETEDAQTAVAPEAPPDTNLGRADRDRATDTVQPQNNYDSNNYDGQWNDSGWSRWGDRSGRSWGNDWTGRDRQWDVDWTSGWDRRTSWDATTAATSGHGDNRHKGGSDDPWSNGRDPWSRGAEDDGQHRDQDGRAGRGQGSDSGERGPASWSGSASYEESGVAWNGWAHYDQGGFQGGDDDRRVNKSNGRASERLMVPTFSGEDTDDIGGSARSYLRQIEAWRRMTYLPPAQQGLVLYQNLSGKAWIAAEELSVPRLGADGGVSYFVSWVNTRFLDIEVARIGKAFSDFFRRLKRRQGQTIREYNSEYDRLHARLREVGCSIPQECAAWLYIDRLQLEEAQELNLLASVGNEYNLHRLQKAAVLHDRGHRKPWENGRSRKPHTAHITHAAEDHDGNDQDLELAADSDLEDGVSEEVAVAYATYQSAKDRYREQSRNRGYRGGRTADNDKGNDNKAELTKDQKVKLMKSRSFCSSCGRKGHWHRDPECPNNGQSNSTKNVKEIEVCHHVAAEVFSLRHEGPALLGITDTACARSVAGTMWLQQYSDALERVYKKPELIKENEAFRFGTGKIHHSSFCVIVYFQFGGKVVEMRTSIINGDVPLLMSKQALGQLGMIFNVAENRADFTQVGVRNLDLVTTSSGHPAICITPAKPATGPQRLVLEESGASTGSQYMAYAVSIAHLQDSTDYATSPSGPSTATQSTTSSSSTTQPTIATSTTKAPPFKIFYDKKLSPEVKELLTQDRLQELSFMGWWEATKVNSDFWLEGDTAWHRIHVVPRRALCNPSTWKTQHTMQKEMLLKSIGDLRCGVNPKILLLATSLSMACKPPAISKMSKTELLSECNRLGLVVHRSWTNEELKATIMEHRMNDPQYQHAATMKSVSNLTLAELKVKADSLNVMYPEKITKGNLLRLIRDAVSTPGTELMKIGKYKGYEFQEIPRQYGMWAAREVRMSQSPHVELVRYAKWWEEHEYEIHYGKDSSLEENATVPYPADDSRRTNKRGASSSGYDPEVMKAMETEIDPATLEEIHELEIRLATLKQKAKAAPGPPKGAK